MHALLREKAGNEVAVRGGPTPFGWGDHDTYVDANLTGLDKVAKLSRGRGRGTREKGRARHEDEGIVMTLLAKAQAIDTQLRPATWKLE